MKRVAIVGGGPAGLMAAERLVGEGVSVEVFDAMPSVGRKFLLAGRGGLNLTHSEAPEVFAMRYGDRQGAVAPWLRALDAQAVRDWAQGLGVDTFVGSSGRVFPVSMKAAPLLRAWLQRLRAAGVRFHTRHRWTGWQHASHTEGAWQLEFQTPTGPVTHTVDAALLAMGGASWPRLGSDGQWASVFAQRGIAVAPLQPANCGFDVAAWTPYFAQRFAGQPFKSVAVRALDAEGGSVTRKGEFVATATGIEGSVIYAISALLRDRIAACGSATVWVDLLPDRSAEQVLAAVKHPRGSRSLGSHLKSRLGLDGIKSALLHEVLPREHWSDAQRVADCIKAAPIQLVAARPIDEVISTAGGVRFEDLDEHLMLRAQPGLFVAGEMLDWEAPTGGYLLTACLASGAVAARGVRQWLGMAPEVIAQATEISAIR